MAEADSDEDGLIGFPEFLRMAIAPAARLERLDELTAVVEEFDAIFGMLIWIGRLGHTNTAFVPESGHYDHLTFNWATFKLFCTANSELWARGHLERLFCLFHERKGQSAGDGWFQGQGQSAENSPWLTAQELSTPVTFTSFLQTMASQVGDRPTIKKTLFRKLNEMVELFQVFDVDSSGGIDLDEMKQIMGCLGQALSHADVLQLVGVDREGDPLELDLHAFTRIMVRPDDQKKQ